MENASENVDLKVGCNLDPYSKGQFTLLRKRIQEILQAFRVKGVLTSYHSLTLLSLSMPRNKLRQEYHFEHLDSSKPLGFIVDKVKIVGSNISCSLNSSEMALTMLGNALYTDGSSGLQQHTTLLLGTVSKPLTNQHDLSQISENLAKLGIGFRIFLRECFIEEAQNPAIPKIFFTNLGARFCFMPSSCRNKLNHLISVELDPSLNVSPQQQISGFLKRVIKSEPMILQTQKDMAFATVQLKHDRSNIEQWLNYLRASTRTRYKVEPSIFDGLLTDGLKFFDNFYLGCLHLENKLDSSTLITEQAQLKLIMTFLRPLVAELSGQGIPRVALGSDVENDVLTELSSLHAQDSEEGKPSGSLASEIRGAAPPAPPFSAAPHVHPPAHSTHSMVRPGLSPAQQGASPGLRAAVRHNRPGLNSDFIDLNKLASPTKLPVFKNTALLDKISKADDEEEEFAVGDGANNTNLPPAHPNPNTAPAPDPSPGPARGNKVEAAQRALEVLKERNPGKYYEFMVNNFERNEELQQIRKENDEQLLLQQRLLSEKEDKARAAELKVAMNDINLQDVNKDNFDLGIPLAVTNPVSPTGRVVPPGGQAAADLTETADPTIRRSALPRSPHQPGPVNINKTDVEFQRSGVTSGTTTQEDTDGYDSIQS